MTRKRSALALAAAVLSAGAAFVAAAPAAPAAPAAAADGAALFQQCAACHGPGGSGTETAPSLIGVVGRRAGAEPDFPYSAAMKRWGKTWTPAELTAFLLRPQAVVPGTRMAYAGAGSPEAAAALTAHLQELR